jgi:DNA-binding CsgD family transcriptional regulator
MALLGQVWLHVRHGDLAAARALAEEIRAISRAAGDRMMSSLALSYLTRMALAAGDAELGRRLAGESLGYAREIGFKPNIVAASGLLGDAARQRGDHAAAWSHYQESLRLARDQGNRAALALALIRLAGFWTVQGQHHLAARYFGAVERWRDLAGAGQPDWYARERHDQDVAATRAELGEAAFAAAWAEGRALRLEEAVAEAMATASPVATPATAGEAAPGPLTGREREVAGLVARGLTSRQMAAALSISPNTAERHVENILNKLGLNSRAQVAAWAVAHGLMPSEET